MGAKIEAAMNAVRPGSQCNACVIAAGSDYNSIRAILGEYDPKLGSPKGTLFATPDSILYKIAIEDTKEEAVSFHCVLLFHVKPKL